MNVPYWLLRLLPMWDYICPRCRREVAKNSHKCPHCGEGYPFPLKVPPKVLKDKKALEEYVHKHVFPRISAWQREYLAQYFTIIFQDGFESGDFSAWTGTVVSSDCSTTVESANPHHGSYNQKSSTTAVSSGEFACVSKNIGSSYSHVFARCYVKYASISGLDANEIIPCVGFWVSQTTTNTARAGLGKDSSGNVRWAIRCYHAGSFYNFFGASTPTTDVWYCVELEVQVGTYGYVKLYVNGKPEISVLDADNSARQFAHVHVGIDYTLGTVGATVYTDCVVVADTYIGPEAVAVTVTDGVGLSDAVLCHKTFAVADSVGLTDVPLKSWAPAVTDVLNLLDAVLSHKQLQVSDTVSLADVALALKILLLTDTISLSDAVEVLVGAIIKVVEDSIGLSDQVFRNKNVVIQDTLTLLDSLLRDKQFSIADALTLTEAVAVSKLLGVSDSVNVSDVALALKTLKISDQIGLLDTVLRNKFMTLSDQISLVDLPRTDKRLIVTDASQLSDVVLALKALLVADVITVADFVTVLLPGFVQVFDSIGLADAVKIDKSLLVQDVLTLLDEVKRNKQLTVTDVVSAIEAVLVGKMFAVSDSVHATDAVLRNKLLSVLDAVGLSEAILCNKQLIVFDVAHVTETVLRNKAMALLDSVGLSDVVKVNKVVIVSDELALAELVTVQLLHVPFYLPIRLKVRKT